MFRFQLWRIESDSVVLFLATSPDLEQQLEEKKISATQYGPSVIFPFGVAYTAGNDSVFAGVASSVTTVAFISSNVSFFFFGVSAV